MSVCCCTPEWPCWLHGTDGRDANLTGVPEAALRVPYPTEERFAELSPGVPWTPPVELRSADRVRDQRPQPAAVATAVPFEPLPKRHGHRRLYVVRWRREGRPSRSKVFRTYGPARKFVDRLSVERTTPGSVFNARRGSRMRKDYVEWITVDRVYVQPSGVQANTRPCESCGQEFVPLRSDARFCGATCRKRANRSQAMSRMLGVT